MHSGPAAVAVPGLGKGLRLTARAHGHARLWPRAFLDVREAMLSSLR
ncbi:hypothetical protein OG394_29140 [Kribbella sp. NBC_01245]|nr:hypothetical protein [Kribbella sp. NBC_01245]